MNIEFSINSLESFTLGIFSGYGEDENGPLHTVIIGILFFEVQFTRYL